MNEKYMPDKYDRYFWFLVAKKGYIEIINDYLEKGIDVNLQDDWGNTSLMVATSWSNIETVKFLLKAGADLSIKNCYSKTAFDIAIDFTVFDISKSHQYLEIYNILGKAKI